MKNLYNQTILTHLERLYAEVFFHIALAVAFQTKVQID